MKIRTQEGALPGISLSEMESKIMTKMPVCAYWIQAKSARTILPDLALGIYIPQIVYGQKNHLTVKRYLGITHTIPGWGLRCISLTPLGGSSSLLPSDR